MRRARVIAGGLLLLGVCACGGSGKSAPSTTASTFGPIPSLSKPPTTTASTPTSTSTSIASATTTAVATVTTDATTATTVDTKVAAEAAVRTSIDAAVTAFRACVAALPHCDTDELAKTRAGTMRDRNVASIAKVNAAGYESRDVEQFHYVIESVTFADDALTRATAQVCTYDAAKLVNPHAGPGGADVVIGDDTPGSGREEWDMRFDSDGVWRPYAGPAIPGQGAKGKDICAPS